MSLSEQGSGSPRVSERGTTLKPNVAESVSTLKPNAAEFVTTLEPSAAEFVTTLKPNAAEFVTALEPSAGEFVTTLKPNAAEFVTTLKPNASEFITTLKLNPNAAEFVPSSLRDQFGKQKQVLDRSDSDEEVRQYWQHQLPDDITPDFKDDHQLSTLSLNDHEPNNTFSPSLGMGTRSSYILNEPNNTFSPPSFVDNITSFGDVPSSATWNMQHFDNTTSFDATMTQPYPNDTLLLDTNNMNPLDFLASQFPGFATESLAEVYFANSCDLNLTIEMLTQLELQVDGGFNQSMNSKTLSVPNLTSMDFPALPVPDNKTSLPKFSGDELQRTVNPYPSSEKDNMLLFKFGSSLRTKGASDFASAVRKRAYQDSGLWKYGRNDSVDATVGSSRSSHVLSGSYNPGALRSAYTDRLHSRGSSRAAPIWLETGDAVANLYSELREEARDHARIRNAFFEQARQAYLIGNKALAKELSAKGQLRNLQMKAAHNKAQDSIYRQRNPISPQVQGGGRSHEKMIDLHGLHVNEAIHVLRHELGVLKNAARSADQCLHVYICVGTGHHTRGSRTPARLPVSVQRYLLEEEGLEYIEPQPGLLRVVLY